MNCITWGAMRRTDKAVLKALTDFLEQGKQPYIPDLAKASECDYRTVSRALKSLERNGNIVRVSRRGRGKTNTYRILTDDQLR
jgi:DNA-binding transcriptional regulator YhcF (GntR family)